jgi:hypothetical protein
MGVPGIPHSPPISLSVSIDWKFREAKKSTLIDVAVPFLGRAANRYHRLRFSTALGSAAPRLLVVFYKRQGNHVIPKPTNEVV